MVKLIKKTMLLSVILIFTNIAFMQGQAKDTIRDKKMDYLLLDPEKLTAIRTRYLEKDADTIKLVDRLKESADSALRVDPCSVMDKKKVPPSGDKHDYVSLSIYYWPGPGGRYVYKDGYVNPESQSDAYDLKSYGKMASAVQTLSLAYYYTGNEAYAEHAVLLLKTWFIDPATRANPNLKYGQCIPGQAEGTQFGLIEIINLPEIIDSAILIYDNSSILLENDMEKFKAWVSDFHQWMLDSDLGKKEDNGKNNHAVWFDVQALAYEIFTGQNDLAVRRIDNRTKRRINEQIGGDGSLKQEIRRTRPLHYSLYAEAAFIAAARLADKVGIDLWNYKTPDGRGIKLALDYLIPYVEGSKSFSMKDVTAENENFAYAVMLRCAAYEYNDIEYLKAADRMLEGAKPNSIDLIYPGNIANPDVSHP
jgi:hypothetical protein